MFELKQCQHAYAFSSIRFNRLCFFSPISKLSYYDNLQVGVVPDEKLLDLLEIAMSSDTAETVKRSRELINSGVDPIALMSQLAGLIMDIIAGTYRLADLHSGDTTLGGRNCECIRQIMFFCSCHSLDDVQSYLLFLYFLLY